MRKGRDVGKYLIVMMRALQHRGRDSSGLAIYSGGSPSSNEFIFRLFTKDVIGAASKVSTAIAKAGGDIRSIHLNTMDEGFGYDKYQIRIDPENLRAVVDSINSTEVSRVISVGRKMEIYKDVCEVSKLDKLFSASELKGTHGIGHVRFSTESKVDLLHAHPFQAFEYPDIAVVHNGQITNYYKMRRKLEGLGHKFETENDSELIVHYVAEKLERGLSFQEALKESVKDLDGPFSYIISTPEGIGVARDKLGLRPAVILDTEEVFAVASEEGALKSIVKSRYIHNLSPGEVATCQKL